MFVDPSGTGQDETAIACGRVSHGRLFVTEVAGFAGGYTDATLQAIAEAAKKWRTNVVVVENNFGDGMFAKLLQPFIQRTHPCVIEEVRATGQKERRLIDTLEPVMNQHRLVVDPSVLRRDAVLRSDVAEEVAIRYRLFYQMTRLTVDRGALAHDDRLDALAGLVKYWLEAFARDSQKSARKYQENKWFEKELRDVVDISSLDRSRRGSTFGFAANAGVREGRRSAALRQPQGPSHGLYRFTMALPSIGRNSTTPAPGTSKRTPT
jgi:hypothetical protein